MPRPQFHLRSLFWLTLVVATLILPAQLAVEAARDWWAERSAPVILHVPPRSVSVDLQEAMPSIFCPPTEYKMQIVPFAADESRETLSL